MNTIPAEKTVPGPRAKKGKNTLNKSGAEDPEHADAGIKPKPDKAAEEGKEPEDTDMAQYQNIDSGKDSSDTERSDNDIEGGDNETENIFK